MRESSGSCLHVGCANEYEDLHAQAQSFNKSRTIPFTVTNNSGTALTIADAVEHPGTVVVHIHDQFLGHAVVMRAGWLRALSLSAIAPLEWVQPQPGLLSASVCRFLDDT